MKRYVGWGYQRRLEFLDEDDELGAEHPNLFRVVY